MRNAKINGNVQITEIIQIDDGDTVQIQSIYTRGLRGDRLSVADIIEKMGTHQHNPSRKSDL